MATDVFGNAADAVAAALGNAQAQRPFVGFFGFTFALKPLDLGVFAVEIFVEQLQALIDQREFKPGEMVFEPTPGCAQFINFSQQRSMFVAVRYQRREQFNLLFGLQHRLMGAVQVVKMGNQRQHTRRHIKRLQHVVAHKISQVAD